MLIKLVSFILLIHSLTALADLAEHSTAGLARRALVIGNGNYQYLPTLDNPINDARDIGRTLEKIGFIVDTQLNATQEQMETAINQFGKHLASGGIGLFYYAGHGVQADGINYIIPVNAELKRQKDLRYKAVNVGQLLDEMDQARNGLNIVILDACRDNPLKEFRSASRGLAEIAAPKGTLVAYATSPGSVAADGVDKNGTYTKHLLKQINIPGLSVEQVFKRVLQGVNKETGGAQLPWVSSSFTGDFYFIAPGGVTVVQSPSVNMGKTEPALQDSAVTQPTKRMTLSDDQFELSFWNSILGSQNVADFQGYLVAYPEGRFIGLAKNRIDLLTSASQSQSIIAESNNAFNAEKYNEYFDKGKRYFYDKERPNKAIAYYKKAIQYRSADEKMHYELGVAYMDLGNYPESIVSFKNAIKQNASYTEAYRQLANSYSELGDEVNAKYYREKGSE